MALPDTIAGPEVLDPAASPSDGSGEQPLPEEVLAEGLIPADAPLAANNEAAPDPIASESGAVESDAAEKAAGTSGSDLPFPTGMEAGYVQLTEAEDALAASVSGTADGSELDPSGTAALIQVVSHAAACAGVVSQHLKAGCCFWLRPCQSCRIGSELPLCPRQLGLIWDVVCIQHVS